MEECQICCEMREDIEILVHDNASETGRAKDGRDVSSHRACGVCRAHMLEKNHSCPWCRDTMVWQDVCGFLDVLKENIKSADEPQGLAALLMNWQEYEMTRSEKDIHLFATHLCEDVGLNAHVDRAIANKNVAFLRDSSGLWVRFYAMVHDGEIQLASEADSQRLNRVVDLILDQFDKDGGGAAAHTGAMYSQLACALLCANLSGSSTATLIRLTRRVGLAAVRAHKIFNKASEVREHCVKEYVVCVSDMVWGSQEKDMMLKTYWPES